MTPGFISCALTLYPVVVRLLEPGDSDVNVFRVGLENVFRHRRNSRRAVELKRGRPAQDPGSEDQVGQSEGVV